VAPLSPVMAQILATEKVTGDRGVLGSRRRVFGANGRVRVVELSGGAVGIRLRLPYRQLNAARP
jgi:hypothetical protein